jgi:hypothetical protein
LKSRLFVLLRDELGLGRQPKVARLLVDEIITVVEATLVDTTVLRPGQVLVLAPEVGQGPSWTWRKLEDKRLKSVILTLIADEDIDRLLAGERPVRVRERRLVRLAREAYEQGTTLTSCQLALMTGLTPARISGQLREYMRRTGEILPMRGVIEDCSSAVSHKSLVITHHLKGKSTSEISRATCHTPRNVERYIQRFEQVRELARYLDKEPEPVTMARILRCSERLVRTYLELIPTTALPAREAQAQS